MPACNPKGVMIILDGLGDRPVAELGDRTPLEAAFTPNLDRLAARGSLGLMDPLFPGVPVATDTGVGLLMGIPPDHDPPARGPIEAMGVGLTMEPEDVALRCNFASVQPRGQGFAIRDRRAGRVGLPDTAHLAETLSAQLGEVEGIRAVVRAATGHRVVLLLTGRALSAAVSDMDPGAGWEEKGVLSAHSLRPGDATAERTAQALNLFVDRAHDILREHPVNMRRREMGLHEANLLLPRKAGQWRQVESVIQGLGIRTAVVAGESTILGLARLLGLTPFHRSHFTGDHHTDLTGKVESVFQALESFDLVFLHVKAPDNLSHDGDFQGKKSFLEKLDRALHPLLGRDDLVIAVCADHSTPCSTGRHSGDPVPVLLAGPSLRRDGGAQYGESACLAGGLGRITSTGLLWSLFDAMGRTRNFLPSDLTNRQGKG